MKYILVKENSYNYLYLFIILIFIIIAYYYYYKYNKIEKFTYNLGKCSNKCCATQWPVPDYIQSDDDIDFSLVSTSNLTCNDGVNNSACVCLSNDAKKLLDSRGSMPIPKANGLLDQDNKKSALIKVGTSTLLPINSNII